MPAFSIIIPVYNGERTLRRCLDSLRRQSFPDFEVLLVENGSTDASRDICREYAEADSRFCIHILTKNRGPSPARNVGLDHARGTYIAFVDCDDYVQPDYLSRLHWAFTTQGWGAVFFGRRQVTLDGREIADQIPEMPECVTDFACLRYLDRQDLFGYTGIKAFRADAIGNTRFPEDLDLLEDEAFACEVLEKGCTVGVLPEPLYCYTTGNGASLMGRTHPDYCRKTDSAYRAWKRLVASRNAQKTILREKSSACIDRCMYYGFERDVEPDGFFAQLAGCEFFTDYPRHDRFYQAVASGNIRKLRWMRRKYRAKVTLSNLLRK